jgi:hypothetical protein
MHECGSDNSSRVLRANCIHIDSTFVKYFHTSLADQPYRMGTNESGTTEGYLKNDVTIHMREIEPPSSFSDQGRETVTREICWQTFSFIIAVITLA